MSYETYYDLLINACVRYDKTKKAIIGKRRNVCNTNIDDTYVDNPIACIDHVPDSPYGGIDLPPDEFHQVHTLCSRHPPSPRPGNTSRPSSRPQSQNSGPNKPIRRYDGPIFLPPQIFKLLSQNAMKALKALKAYNTEAIPCPQNSTMIPERTINHHLTYHVAQASQAKHSSLVDRGANGGLAGSDVRILSTSSRKCTATGIDSHELQGLDVVQCAALVETSHGIVNLIMNEYACYGKGHTIHSSGQIEWFKNSVEDRSVQVGGKQRICTIDGYAMPFTCRGGLMYLSILGKPTDSDLERYPAVHLTGPHE